MAKKVEYDITNSAEVPPEPPVTATGLFNTLLAQLEAERPVGATNELERRWDAVVNKVEDAQALFVSRCAPEVAPV